jgi:uncharacterized damage-inducible protein DinB
MNQKSLAVAWDHIRQLNGIAMRCVEALPEDRLESRPIPNMRTPGELVTHMYRTVKNVAEGVVSGSVVEPDDPAGAPRIANKKELVDFCLQCWNAANHAVETTTDAQLAATVETPWNMTFPGAVGYSIIRDELLHHRGQLYAYLRAMGQDVPHMWDFQGNAPQFKPQQTAGV